ncbi:MAG: hypothetical protein DIU78_023365 [Pseudomonadota bacterium]
MAKSPNDAASGDGSLDPEEAERLAALFRPSWEAPPPVEAAAGSAASVNGSAHPSTEKPSSPAQRPREAANPFGVPNGVQVNPKKTLIGLPPPAGLTPAPGPAGPVGAGAERRSSPTAARSERTTQPPVHQRPARQALSEAPPAPPSDPRAANPPAARASSPRSEPSSSPKVVKPTGVAKAYVPKEAPDTPAVVVDEAMLRAGEAAAAEEEAARRARLNARRHAATVPGSRALEEAIRAALPHRRRRRARLIAVAALAAVGVVGGVVALGFSGAERSTISAAPEPPVEPASPAAALHVPPPPPATESEPTPEPVAIEALPTESEVASAQRDNDKPSGRTTALRTSTSTEEARSKDGDAARRSTAERRSEKEGKAATAKRESGGTTSTRPSADEPSKRKKSVIVRDTPF